MKVGKWVRSMKQVKSMGGMTDITEVGSINEASGICELKRRHTNRSIKHESTWYNVNKATSMRWGGWGSMRDGKYVHGVTNVHGVTIMNEEQSRK